MKLSQFYDFTVRFGKERDPRGIKGVSAFEDTAVLYGNPDTDVQGILIGIDIDSAELLLADRLKHKKNIDLVLSHHPSGPAWASFYRVMPLQSVLWQKIGIDENTVNGFLAERMREVERKVMAYNHMRAVDTARLLDMPLMCAHTPADNHVASYLQGMFDEMRPGKVADVLAILEDIPEYKRASAEKCGPRLIIGGQKRGCGRIFVDMTGGTEGPKQLFEKLTDSEVGTVVSMHLSEEHFSRIRNGDVNVIVAGHIPSDTLGMNLLLDRIESASKENFTVTECSGFRRISRI